MPPDHDNLLSLLHDHQLDRIMVELLGDQEKQAAELAALLDDPEHDRLIAELLADMPTLDYDQDDALDLDDGGDQ